MIPLPLRGTAAVFLAMLALTGCAGATRGPVTTAPQAGSAAAADSAAVARARADSIRHPYTEADVRFMTSMIGHHAQAIEMAHLAPTRAQSASVKTLAERIINGQQDEIRTMQQWLRDRRKPVPEPDIAAMHDGTTSTAHGEQQGSHGAMTHDSAHHAAHHPSGDSTGHAASHNGTHRGDGHAMPGMLSEEEMNRLRDARGAEFDRLFLSSMIQHHRGAVSMVEQLFGTYGAAQDETVFKFASDVNVDQITEIARMERMLRSLLFEVPAP